MMIAVSGPEDDGAKHHGGGDQLTACNLSQRVQPLAAKAGCNIEWRFRPERQAIQKNQRYADSQHRQRQYLSVTKPADGQLPRVKYLVDDGAEERSIEKGAAGKDRHLDASNHDQR